MAPEAAHRGARTGGQRRSRRYWLAMAGAGSAGLLLASKGTGEQVADEADVTPPEDLMREHGVLKRVLLVHDEVIRRIASKREVPWEAVRGGADITRSFIEASHEKLEEDYLFPRFEKAGKLTVASIERTLGIYDLAQFTPR